MAKGLPEYTDKELLQMLEEFKALSEEDKQLRRIGSGVDKIAYDIPGKDLVLKIPNTERAYNKYGLDTDYINSKLMNKSIPVETPVLIKQPAGFGESDVLIQRKLKPVDETTTPKTEFYDSLFDKFPNDKEARAAALAAEKQRIKNLPDQKAVMEYLKTFDKVGLNDADLHTQNIGLDKQGVAKALDVAPFYYDRVNNSNTLNSGLKRAREVFYDKMDALTKPRIYRSITPTLLKGLGAAAGGAASLAAEASDAEDLGNASEQAAMLREIDQANREKKMLGMVPEQNKAAVEKELEDQRLGLRRSAIESLLKK